MVSLHLWLACLLLRGAWPKPACDPRSCPPCPQGSPQGPAAAAGSACCPPCPPSCPCPPYLQDDCELHGFPAGLVPAGRAFHIDFGRSLCRCGPAGAVACARLCPPPPPACRALGSPRADGCPGCVCYDRDGLAVPAGSTRARNGTRPCRCPALGGELECGEPGQ